jgi:metallo-beta-lactamase family protein
MSYKAKIGFYGAVDSVTGNNFYFEAQGMKIMIDCGLYQGAKYADERNHESFQIKPADIDVLIITHSHIDHVGRIPKFVKEGFHGKILSTKPTKRLADLMLHDTVNILAHEAIVDGVPPIYEERDVYEAMKLWHTVEYYDRYDLADNLSFVFHDSGHMLGSAMVRIKLGSDEMVFTGDLGNSPTPLIRDTDSIEGVKYLLMEAVYGDRNHEDRSTRKENLRKAILESIGKSGTLLIPAFSIERTQELLFELNEMVEHHKLPTVKIFIDSPLAIKATQVYRDSEKYFNKEVQHIIKSGDDVFRFPNLFFTETRGESMSIWDYHGPKVIMAGSGMMNGGRIMHHFKHFAGDPKTAILLAGYQAVGTIGRRVLDGERSIRMGDDDIKVRASVSVLNGYSGHKDLDHLLEFVETGSKTLKKVFVAIGEPHSTMFLAQRINDYLGLNAVVPELGATVELEFDD